MAKGKFKEKTDDYWISIGKGDFALTTPKPEKSAILIKHSTEPETMKMAEMLAEKFKAKLAQYYWVVKDFRKNVDKTFDIRVFKSLGTLKKSILG